MTRAAQRLRVNGDDADRIAFVQADLFDLPFVSGSFATVACFGMLHLFENLPDTLAALRQQVAPDGSLYAPPCLPRPPSAGAPRP